ncbi:MAG: hypothetical protein M1834_005267 [Cirrosporium novae-zelandiae]|nr:MAG: hypothetical protein M1834_005267 [Cirrosporium novae-zelandiae]
MEQELLQVLSQTQSSEEGPRKHAEAQLARLHTNPTFPVSLASIASHNEVPTSLRQQALIILRTFVVHSWSPALDDFRGDVLVDDATKSQLRPLLLQLATSGNADRKIKVAASAVVSKIARADFPDQWPDLLPFLLATISRATESQLHGALRVLGELVDDGFDEMQFFKSARELVKVLFDVAANGQHKSTLRALAISVFRGCFDTLEMVMEDHKAAVKQFADEALGAWAPMFTTIMRSPLPAVPSEDEENAGTGTALEWRGTITLKLQVVKTLMKIRSVLPVLLIPQSLVFFSVTWQELSGLQNAYRQLYIDDERQGRLIDSDELPYTLDFLVMEELDFVQSLLRAPPVRAELEKQLAEGTSPNWLTEMMKLSVAYAQITTEEEGLWDIDVNVFLSEETSVTANYTPRTACGDLIIKLSEWLKLVCLQAHLGYTTTLFSDPGSTWKAKEAALYVLGQDLMDLHDVQQSIPTEIANSYTQFVQYSMQQEDPFLRARGFLIGGMILKTSAQPLHQIARAYLETSLKAICDDPSDVVKVACIRVLQDYLEILPSQTTKPVQGAIISALANYLNAQDMSELIDSDDVIVTLTETLRDAIMIDVGICVNSLALDILFNIASQGAANFQVASIVTEAFEDITESVAEQGPEAFTRLCERVLPTLSGAFDVANISEENALTNLAAELLNALAENSCKPLPAGFVAAVMPKLNRLLLTSEDPELLGPATSAITHMLSHDCPQFLAWHDQTTNKGALETALIIVDRLLSPTIEDIAAQEVGKLAAELVEKAGGEKLGPYLPQLLRAVAQRLASASHAQFIQSLILVFGRLSLISPQEVINFLASISVDNQSGLAVVMAKWLEHSIEFVGYQEIRQNVMALTNIYRLEDARLANIQVKGEIIVPQSDRIMTRSQSLAHPEQYTMIPIPLKIIKVLISEFSTPSSSPLRRQLDAAALASLDEEGSGDEEWEDEPNSLDLGSAATRQDLMAYADGANRFRERDDETQKCLVGFFREAAEKPVFQERFNALTDEEKRLLQEGMQG